MILSSIHYHIGLQNINHFQIMIDSTGVLRLQTWTNSLGQFSVLSFNSLFIMVLLQPPPPHSMLLGGNEVKTVCITESGPVYAQH